VKVMTGDRMVIDASSRTRNGWGTLTEEKVRNAGAVMRSVDKLMIEGKHSLKNDLQQIFLIVRDRMIQQKQ
jgi:hypothetical protein